MSDPRPISRVYPSGEVAEVMPIVGSPWGGWQVAYWPDLAAYGADEPPLILDHVGATAAFDTEAEALAELWPEEAAS